MLKNSANSLFLSSQISFSSIVLISTLSCQSILAEEVNSIQDMLSGTITGNQDYSVVETQSVKRVYYKYEMTAGGSTPTPIPPGVKVSNITDTYDPKWGQALLNLDMTNYNRIKITVEYYHPYGYVTNLGSSSANHGEGEDVPTESIDSEISLFSRYDPPMGLSPYPDFYPLPLYVCADNDHKRDISIVWDLVHNDATEWVSYDITSVLPSPPKFPNRATAIKIYKGDSNSPNKLVATFGGENILNLDPNRWDEEAKSYNDMQLWLGLNRVINENDNRGGRGAKRVKIELWGITK